MIDKRKESLFLLFQKRAEWFKNLLVRAVTLARKVHPSQTEAQPHVPNSWRCCGSWHRNVHVHEVTHQEFIVRLHPEGPHPGSSFPSS